jgi:hypothetical protein
MPFTVLVPFDFVSSGDNVIVNELTFLPTHELVKDLFGFFISKEYYFGSVYIFLPSLVAPLVFCNVIILNGLPSFISVINRSCCLTS